MARARRVGGAGWFTALLHNGHGRYGEALAAAQQACEHEDVIFYGWALVELIEAGVRSGQPDEAAAALDRLSERTQASGTEWALGIEARCRGLLSDDESLYQESVERLARSRAAVELARSRLVYGEWLRRENRRVDAREQLRAAHEMFSRMGAAAFAERARRELSATGETVRKRTVETLDELTTQEAQVARLAADGHTNPEIGAAAVHQPAHRRVPPAQGVHKARYQFAQRPPKGAPGAGARGRARLAPPSFSPLKRGELFLEAGNRVPIEEGTPAHAGHAECGQLRDRRSLFKAYDVHRAPNF